MFNSFYRNFHSVVTGMHIRREFLSKFKVSPYLVVEVSEIGRLGFQTVDYGNGLRNGEM